jgi:hypothetical protein
MSVFLKSTIGGQIALVNLKTGLLTATKITDLFAIIFTFVGRDH